MRWVLVVIALGGCDKLFLGREPLDGSVVDDVADLPFGTPVPIASLNTGAEEDRPTLTDDLRELYFHRGGTLLVAKRSAADADFGAPTELTELAQGFTNSRACVSGDGLRLYFSRRLTMNADLDIYVTTRDGRDAPWGTATRIDELATMLPDGDEYCGWENAARTTLLLATTYPGTQDIVHADRQAAGGPFTIIDGIVDFNTSDREGAPWANEDGTIVVFDRGTSPSKLYQATLQATRYAVRLLSELDLPGNVGSPWLSKDGRLIVFARDNDLFMATR